MKLNEIIRTVITSFITSDGLRDIKRQYYELKRKILRRTHEVHFFFQVDDPYSYLASQVIEDLEKNYQIAVKVHLVGRPEKNSAPKETLTNIYKDRLDTYSKAEITINSHEKSSLEEMADLVIKSLLSRNYIIERT